MRIEPATVDERDILENLMQPYLHELSQFDLYLPNDRGKYEYGALLDLYWDEPQRYPYLFRDDGAIVGFGLVR